MCTVLYGLERRKWPALAEALVESNLNGWKDWHEAESPIWWVRKVAENIYNGHEPLSMDGHPNMFSLDAQSPTRDPYAALLRDPDGDRLGPEIHARVDLVTACERERLAPETSLLAVGQYNSVPLSLATDVLGLSKQQLVAASRELKAARPALRARLASYRLKRATQMRQI